MLDGLLEEQQNGLPAAYYNGCCNYDDLPTAYLNGCCNYDDLPAAYQNGCCIYEGLPAAYQNGCCNYDEYPAGCHDNQTELEEPEVATLKSNLFLRFNYYNSFMYNKTYRYVQMM